MLFRDFLGKMTPGIYQALKQSVETGRWPDGRKLSDKEQEAGIQALIAWEHEHLSERQRTGYMPVPLPEKPESDSDSG